MLLQLHPGLMIWTVLTFFVLLFVLRLIAWKPILNMLETRENKIRGDLDNAAKDRAEAEKTLNEIRSQLDQARKEANSIVSEARNLAEKARENILAQTKSEREKMIAQAKTEIQLEREKTAQALKTELASLVVNAAGQIIKQKLSPEDHSQLINQSLSEMK
jgi:F-type H+-transporting ATPase subunit b